MRSNLFATSLVLMVCAAVTARAEDAKPAAEKADPQWAMNASIIEACSCPMFCQCYFNGEPAAAHAPGHEGHAAAGEHFCRFNNAYQVNKGTFGDAKLDGAKFWVAGDLGGDFTKGQMDWAVLTFDPSVTPEQRDGIKAILGHVYPVKWSSFTVADDKPMEWKATKDKAEARLDGGKAAEVVLNRFAGNDTAEPVVIRNLKYWGVPRNEGFILMPNTVEALRAAPEGKQPFEFKGTNGFMITFDINSEDVAAAKAKESESKEGQGKKASAEPSHAHHSG
jgi:hypothetical protein